MNHLENGEVNAPQNLNSKEYYKFFLERFLMAYNRWKGTSLEYSDVEPFCEMQNKEVTHKNNNDWKAA